MPYIWTLPVSVEPFAWATAADEWLHCLSGCAAERDGGIRVAGHRFDETTRPFIEVLGDRPGGERSSTLLLLLPDNEGVAVYLGGRAEGIDDEIAEAWAAAVACATNRLGQITEHFEWSAIIGARGEGRSGGRFALGHRFEIGAFELSPAGRPLTQVNRNIVAPSLNSASTHHSWPVVVRGRHSGFNWAAANKRAAFDLRRLCALLSLDVEYHTWSVLEAPVPLAWGERCVPERGYPFYSASPRGTFAEPPSEPESLWEPSGWLPQAWVVMMQRPWLANAVVMHHEGQLTDEEHPSLAHVAYVSAVEAISNHLFDEERCEQCGAHLNVAARFRATLQLVLDPVQAARLAASYGNRSTSVHQGRLHGSDNAPGFFGFAWNDPQRDFDYQVVLGMRSASRALLVLALQGGLPARTRFSPAE